MISDNWFDEIFAADVVVDEPETELSLSNNNKSSWIVQLVAKAFQPWKLFLYLFETEVTFTSVIAHFLLNY